MTGISPLPKGPARGQHGGARPAYVLIDRTHSSVTGLFDSVSLLSETRRAANPSTKGRSAKLEVDVLRSAIVFTSAGLDASMKRLVNDVGRSLITKDTTAAYAQYQAYLKSELALPQVSAPLREAVLSRDVASRLVSHYFGEKTKASFQGSGDLQKRVRQTLGISQSIVPDHVFRDLDVFFVARNNIVHQMDLVDPFSESIRRVHRTPEVVAEMCSQVFDVAVQLINAAASTVRSAGL